EVGDGPNRFRLLGDLERRLGGGDRGIVALGFRHQGQRLLGLLGGAGAHVAAREAGERGDVAAVLRQHLGVEIGRARGIALGERVIGALQQIFFLAAEAILGDALDESRHLAFRQRAEKTVDRLAVDEGEHCRDRLDAELPRNRGVLVDVHLDELYLALGGAHDLFQHRTQLLARPAPFGPEIHQHRLALGFLDHVLDEGLGGRVLDHAAGGRRLPALQHRHFVRPSSVPSTPAGFGRSIGPFGAIQWGIAARGSRRAPPPRKTRIWPIKWCQRGCLQSITQSCAGASCSATAAIRGGWPVASRNRTRSARAIEVVMVLTSGWQLTVSWRISAASSTTLTRRSLSFIAANGVTARGSMPSVTRRRSAGPKEKRPEAARRRCSDF